MNQAQHLAKLYQEACLAELQALKPGNVHIFADGHGMVVQDFITSAQVSAPHISNPDLTLGERILNSMQATWDAVGCNTNLGIILLCAPMMQAALQSQQGDFLDALDSVLKNTTIQDAQHAFDAITLANPAGLGQASHQDVNQKASETLLKAMAIAADRDLIAQQYTTNYESVFKSALPVYRQHLTQWDNTAWAITAVYLYWLAHHEDSHLVRKYNQDVAQQVKQAACMHYDAFSVLDNPKTYMAKLLEFDQALKAQRYNPGTCADLTVATLLAHDLYT